MMITHAPLKRGFTVVELIIVLVIIGLLSGIAYVAYSAVQNEADRRTLRSFAQALDHEATAIGVGNSPQDGPAANVRSVLDDHFGEPTTNSGVDYWGDPHGNKIFVSTTGNGSYWVGRGSATGATVWSCYIPGTTAGSYTDPSGYENNPC